MTAFILQIVALVGLPIGGYLVGDIGGAVVGASVSVGYVGLSLEGRR